jgi:hypothetical protein
MYSPVQSESSSNLLRYLRLHINNSMNQILNNLIARLFARDLDLFKLGLGFFVGFFFGFFVSA